MKISRIVLFLSAFLTASSSFSQTTDDSIEVVEISVEADSSDTESVSTGCCVGSSDCAAALQTLPPLPEELEALVETK